MYPDPCFTDSARLPQPPAAHCRLPAASLYVVVLLAFAANGVAASDDVIYTKNGDRITGEIKKLQRGVIHIDPSYGENVFQIDWDDVMRVESARSYIIETSGGRRLSGTVKQNPEDPQELVVADDSGSIAVERPNVVAVLPIDAGFWNRMALDIDVGTSITKANSSKQANISALAGYTAERWRLEGVFNLVRNTVGDEETNRREADAKYFRLIREKFFGVAGANFLRSDELQLDLRTTVAPGIGRFLKRTNRMSWSVAGGAQWLNERFTDPELAPKSSAEGWAATEVNLFNFGDVSWLTQFKVSPGMSESGRVRIDFNSDFKIDLPKDLYFRIGIQDNFDSRPSNDAPRNDYVVSLGVGWSL